MFRSVWGAVNRALGIVIQMGKTAARDQLGILSDAQAKMAIVFDLSATWIHNVIPPVAVLAGAAAFGFWWGSISAGLFACFALSFLAAIYKALRQIVSILHWERDCKLSENSNGSSITMRSEQDFEVSARAIEHLRPWVEDETSLTEERAKACCAVLLDTLATLHPKFAK